MYLLSVLTGDVPFKSWTLIGLGKVKVDLTEFDLKLQENLLSTFFNTYSCRNVFRFFLNFWHDLTDHPRVWEVPPAVVRSLARRQSGYQSVSGPIPHRVQGLVGSQLGLVSRSFEVRTDLGKFPKLADSIEWWHTHTSYTRPYSWTGIFQFGPHQSLYYWSENEI